MTLDLGIRSLPPFTLVAARHVTFGKDSLRDRPYLVKAIGLLFKAWESNLGLSRLPAQSSKPAADMT